MALPLGEEDCTQQPLFGVAHYCPTPAPEAQPPVEEAQPEPAEDMEELFPGLGHQAQAHAARWVQARERFNAGGLFQ